MIYNEARDPEEEALDKGAAEWLMNQLDPEARDIINLWVVEELNFDEIGKIIGAKYYSEAMPGTTVRYRKDKIMRQLRELRNEVGLGE